MGMMEEKESCLECQSLQASAPLPRGPAGDLLVQEGVVGPTWRYINPNSAHFTSCAF